jgi:mannose-P-dolichol utilization defect protein 1
MDFKELLSVAISEKCAASILSYDFEDIECVKLTISKLLSYAILLGAVFVKVPQIFNIVKAKSAKGISFSSILMETLSIIILLAYNVREKNPLSTFGELGFLTVQNIIIMMLILVYQEQLIYSATLVFAVSRGASYLMDPAWVSDELMAKLQLSSIFIGIASKLPQVFSNFRAKSTVIASFISRANCLVLPHFYSSLALWLEF